MKIKKILIYLFAVGAVVLLIKNASSAIRYASDAIDLCLEMIVPTLFPFFICSGILIYSGFCELLAKAFQFCMYPLFRISPVGSSAFILGIVSGYPLGMNIMLMPSKSASIVSLMITSVAIRQE